MSEALWFHHSERSDGMPASQVLRQAEFIRRSSTCHMGHDMECLLLARGPVRLRSSHVPSTDSGQSVVGMGARPECVMGARWSRARPRSIRRSRCPESLPKPLPNRCIPSRELLVCLLLQPMYCPCELRLGALGLGERHLGGCQLAAQAMQLDCILLGCCCL